MKLINFKIIILLNYKVVKLLNCEEEKIMIKLYKCKPTKLWKNIILKAQQCESMNMWKYKWRKLYIMELRVGKIINCES